jgi:hypothetical protein
MNWSELRYELDLLRSLWNSLKPSIQRVILLTVFFQPWFSAFSIFTGLKDSDVFLFNEEALVTVTFIAFVLVSSRALSETLSETFAERRALIRKALALNLAKKEQHLKDLLIELEKHKKLSQQTRDVESLTLEKMKLFGELQSIAQANNVRESVRQCLDQISHLDKKCQDEFQTAFLKGYIPSVRHAFRLGGTSAYALDMRNTFNVLGNLSKGGKRKS